MTAVPRWFANELAVLYDCFPGSKLTETTPLSWWRVLGDYPDWAIRKAFVQAPREAAQGRYLPSAEDVRRVADVLAAHPPTPPAPYRPQLPEAVGAGSLPESNRFMRLARQWEHESRELELNPDRPSPSEVATRRMTELLASLDGGLQCWPDGRHDRPRIEQKPG